MRLQIWETLKTLRFSFRTVHDSDSDTRKHLVIINMEVYLYCCLSGAVLLINNIIVSVSLKMWEETSKLLRVVVFLP